MVAAEEGKEALLVDCGRMVYTDALALQHRCADWRHRESSAEDIFLFVEHLPVFTLGRNCGLKGLLVDETVLREKGIALCRVDRGGDITWHGPGQLVIYPIISLRAAGLGVAEYVSLLEELMIRLAALFGVTAGRDQRNHGAWVGNNKIGSIGIHVGHGITSHGLAFNIDPDLSHFALINPCGLQQVGVTSLAGEGAAVSFAEVKTAAVGLIEELFSCRLVATEQQDVLFSAV